MGMGGILGAICLFFPPFEGVGAILAGFPHFGGHFGVIWLGFSILKAILADFPSFWGTFWGNFCFFPPIWGWFSLILGDILVPLILGIFWAQLGGLGGQIWAPILKNWGPNWPRILS